MHTLLVAYVAHAVHTAHTAHAVHIAHTAHTAHVIENSHKIYRHMYTTIACKKIAHLHGEDVVAAAAGVIHRGASHGPTRAHRVLYTLGAWYRTCSAYGAYNTYSALHQNSHNKGAKIQPRHIKMAHLHGEYAVAAAAGVVHRGASHCSAGHPLIDQSLHARRRGHHHLL